MLVAAARQHSRNQFPQRTEHDPLSIYVEFLETVPQGPFHMLLEVLRSGVSESTIQAQIVPTNGLNHLIYCHCIIRIGSFDKKTHTVDDDIEKTDVEKTVTRLPDRVKDCSRWVNAFFYNWKVPLQA